jgi:hypothetical protein
VVIVNPPPWEAPDELLPEDNGPDGMRVARIAIAIVVLIVVVAIVLSNSASPSDQGSNPTPITTAPITVNVTQVLVSVPTDACGLSGITPGAFSVSAYTPFPLGWWLPWSSGSLPCSVTNITTSTPGFGIGSGNFPLEVTSDQTPLVFTVNCPASYNGTLSLTVFGTNGG